MLILRECISSILKGGRLRIILNCAANSSESRVSLSMIRLNSDSILSHEKFESVLITDLVADAFT